jgi:hypothetical protein
MNRGPKRQLPSEKRAKGTYQPVRDANVVEVVEPTAMPLQPDWLSAEGQEVWQDDIGRVLSSRLVTERDSTAFANYCSLQALIVKCWRAGEAPPVAALVEARKMQELFGIAGARSRLQVKPEGGKSNPFARNGARK